MFLSSMFLKIIFVITFLSFLGGCNSNEGKKIFEQAISLWKQSQYDEAIQNLIALTKAFPNHNLVDDSLFWIANIYNHYLKEPKQSIRYYRSLNRSFKDSEYYTQSMLDLAEIYQSGNTEDQRRAVHIYEKLQTLSPSLEQWEKNQYHLAHIFYNLKEFKKARVVLKELILKSPNSKYIPQAYYLIGSSYYMEGKTQLAITTFIETEILFSYSKETLPVANALAHIYEEMGDLKKSINIYGKIMDRLKSDDLLYKVFKKRIKDLKERLRKIKN